MNYAIHIQSNGFSLLFPSFNSFFKFILGFVFVYSSIIQQNFTLFHRAFDTVQQNTLDFNSCMIRANQCRKSTSFFLFSFFFLKRRHMKLYYFSIAALNSCKKKKKRNNFDRLVRYTRQVPEWKKKCENEENKLYK